MANILTISSQVTCGHVGNSTSVFVLQRMGHNVLPVPTILLSHHAGHKNFAASKINTSLLSKIVNMIKINEQLPKIDAVISGYMPSEDHVFFTKETLKQIKSQNPNMLYMCDPVIGDYPKGIYIKPSIAEMIKEHLLPLADIITPNLFEFQWLTNSQTTQIEEILNLSKSLNINDILVTSAPGENNKTIKNLLFSENETCATEVKKHINPPQGTGDLMASLFIGHVLNNRTKKEALSYATSGVEAVLSQSQKQNELQLITTQEKWVQEKPWQTVNL